jgi:hypothetical protein
VAYPRKTPPPSEQLARLLADAKRNGVPFEEAWTTIMRRARTRHSGDTHSDTLLWPHAVDERRGWKRVLADPAVIGEWRASFEGVETPYSRAFALVAAGSDASSFATPAGTTVTREAFVRPKRGLTMTTHRERSDLTLDPRVTLEWLFPDAAARRRIEASEAA